MNRVQQVINTAQQAVRNSTINATSHIRQSFRVMAMKLLPESEGYAVVAGSIQQLLRRTL